MSIINKTVTNQLTIFGIFDKFMNPLKLIWLYENIKMKFKKNDSDALSKKPLVSIVIVNYNRKKDLEACLNSVRKTNYPHYELIIVDNGSTDGSVEVVKRNFKWVNLIENKENVGPVKARNMGIRRSSGRLIAFLDSDTEVSKNWLSELVKIIESDKKIGACTSKVKLFSNKNLINSAGMGCDKYGFAFSRGLVCRGVFEKDKGQYDKCEEVFSIYTAAMLARKDVLKKVKLFNQDLEMYYEDIELSWKIRLAGYKIMYVPTSVVFHKMSLIKTPFTIKTKHYTERNRLMTMLQNYSFSMLIQTLPVYFFLKFSEFFLYLGFGKFKLAWNILSGILFNVKKLSKILKWRKLVQNKIRKVSDREVIEHMENYSIEWHMFMKGYGNYLLR